jgi:hypothetical protein
LTSSRQTRLALRLQNDEAKCKNCQHWKTEYEAQAIGVCQANAPTTHTLDLSVCSVWAPKQETMTHGQQT